MTAKNDRIFIPDRSRPGTTTAFPVGHQGGNDKCATGAKLRGRKDITIATWTVRTLRAAGKVEEFLHEMDRYKWSILGLCEMRCKTSGEIPTDGGHRVISGKEDKHEQGVGFLVHKDIMKSVIGCRPISSRLMRVRLRASPFNITIIQVYAPTSSYDDSDVDEFYRELQSLVDQTPKQDILVVQGDWNAKVGEDAKEDWGEVCGRSCNPETMTEGSSS